MQQTRRKQAKQKTKTQEKLLPAGPTRPAPPGAVNLQPAARGPGRRRREAAAPPGRPRSRRPRIQYRTGSSASGRKERIILGRDAGVPGVLRHQLVQQESRRGIGRLVGRGRRPSQNAEVGIVGVPRLRPPGPHLRPAEDRVHSDHRAQALLPLLLRVVLGVNGVVHEVG